MEWVMNASREAHLETTAAHDGYGESACAYELRFIALFSSGRGYAFPCDASGNVDLDHLGERARANYLYARAVVGREFFAPVTRTVLCPIRSFP
jgi:hypothetical protein